MGAALFAVLELDLREDDRVTTVNWERMSGEAVELSVAAALTKTRGGGGQITPSAGDGGIDVLLPRDDGMWEVVQVKRYARPLDSKQKKSQFRDRCLHRFNLAVLDRSVACRAMTPQTTIRLGRKCAVHDPVPLVQN